MSFLTNEVGKSEETETSLKELFPNASADEVLALVRAIEKSHPGFVLDLIRDIKILGEGQVT